MLQNEDVYKADKAELRRILTEYLGHDTDAVNRIKGTLYGQDVSNPHMQRGRVLWRRISAWESKQKYSGHTGSQVTQEC